MDEMLTFRQIQGFRYYFGVTLGTQFRIPQQWRVTGLQGHSYSQKNAGNIIQETQYDIKLAGKTYAKTTGC